MICVVIKGPTFEKAKEQIAEALAYADLVELRLDYFESLTLNALNELRSQFPIPMIFTLRSRVHGGAYLESEEKRLALIRDLAALKPEYFDLENVIPRDFIDEITTRFPEIKLILSYHNFSETPIDLDAIYREMRKIPAFFYKIAVMAKHCLDALKLMCWAKKSDHQLIAISMGSDGEISRILGPIIGSPITYAALEEQQSAPGQLFVKTLYDRYGYRKMNPKTAVYALIGDPVSHSISDVSHNDLIASCDLDAVYVKCQISNSELFDFVKLANKIPFNGMSVTMPLKERVIDFLDNIDSEARDIGAVNTLLFEKGKIFGFNTDGKGALNAIEKTEKVKNKHVIIIGTGGAARAIAYEALKRGAMVTIVGRDAAKAAQIAKHLHCEGKGLDHMADCSEAGYDMLINCTPAGRPINSDYILSQTLVMDISTRSKETLFLRLAKEKGCRIVYGYQMFIEQALGQFTIWFKERFHVKKGKEILEKKVNAILLKL